MIKKIMKQNFNYHTHTYRCGHASGTDEEYVLAAIKAGYKTLGFSDHCPYRNYPITHIHMNWEMFDEYVESINNLKEKYKDVIDIKIGLESEYFKECLDEKYELREKLDYMILGQHYHELDGSGSYFRENSDDEIRDYTKAICEGMETGLYSYLCHPDVIVTRQTEFNDALSESAHMIGKKAAETNTPLEINVRGVKRGLQLFPENRYRYYYPNKDFWDILVQYPIKVIVGIDAHSPEELLDMEMLETGLNEMTGYDLEYIKEPFIL